MEQVQNDWNALKDEQEVEIIRKYTQSGRKHLYAFAGRKSDRNTNYMEYKNFFDKCAFLFVI